MSNAVHGRFVAGGVAHINDDRLTSVLLRRGMRIQALIEPQLDPQLAEMVLELMRHVHVPGFVALHAVKRLG